MAAFHTTDLALTITLEAKEGNKPFQLQVACAPGTCTGTVGKAMSSGDMLKDEGNLVALREALINMLKEIPSPAEPLA
jgi:hypothetical protein